MGFTGEIEVVYLQLSLLGKGGLHLGKPSQIWISPNRGGPPDPDFLHGYEKSRFLGEGGVKDRTYLRSRFNFG